MICCWPKKVSYRLYGGKDEYQLLPFAPDCYVIEESKRIGYLDTMTLHHNRLEIAHFAVDSSQIGKGIAEQVLRGFAAIVAKQAPQVTCIYFDLRRAAPNSNIGNLAQARANLFHKIGAVNVQQRQIALQTISVSATWNKVDW